MSYPAKYTPDQREEVYDLYWHGREKVRRNHRGTYTLKEIEEITGVERRSVWAIARGER